MATYLFLITTLYAIVYLFLIIYFIIKTKYALQAYQQSSYNFSRTINYIKKNYKYTFGINELLPIIILIIFKNIHLLKQPFSMIFKIFLLLFVLNYTIKFFNISKKQYTEKIPLKYTWRVKRIIITMSLIILLLFNIKFNFFLLDSLVLKTTLITYFIYPIIILSGFINIPIEKLIQNKFKKKAHNKIMNYNNLTKIAITGSYGKTSIKNIINNILVEEEITLQTPSSFNTPMGLCITINKDLNIHHENFIAEMGAYYQGEIKELCDLIKPSIGIVSSIGPQHLETFKNIETIQKTKMELIEELPSDGLGILNYDNEYIRSYSVQNDVPIKWYSLENENVDLYAYDLMYLDDGMKFKIRLNNEEHLITTKLLGKHNVYNILAAILVAQHKNIALKKIINLIKNMPLIPNRLEIKKINNEITIIDDSFNGNIEGMLEGLKILQQSKKIKILITPGIIDGGKEEYSLNKKYAQNISGIDYVIIIGNYNKKAFKEGIKFEQKTKYFKNFLEGYEYATNQINGSKMILISNDLPDKFN